MSLVVAIIGRPNVGKSTMFNRLTGSKHAIVHDQPGVTRDIREGQGSIGPMCFKVIDTPGLEHASRESLSSRMSLQTKKAVLLSDVVLMMVDGKAGLLPDDKIFSDWLRKLNKPSILVVNKCESKKISSRISEFYQLGFDEMVCISAEHGEGLADLYDVLDPFQIQYEKKETENKKLTIAIVGKPNAGKSTLINQILKDERVLTGPEAGITRDAIAIDWNYQGKDIRLIDTAGIRKKSKIDSQIEKLALEDSFRAIQYANVVILLIDANHAFESQDIAIATKVLEEGRALVIGINKWDQIEEKSSFVNNLNYQLNKSLTKAKGVFVSYLSARLGTGIEKMLDNVLKAYDLWNFRASTSKINDWLAYALEKHQLPLSKSGKRIKIKYATQVKSRPPTFILFANYPADINDNYTKYLTNSLREYFELPGVTIRISYKKSPNPFED